MTTLSPPLEPAQYNRRKSDIGSTVSEKVYGKWKVHPDRAKWVDGGMKYDDDMVMFNGELGEVYVGHGHVHVSDSLYRSHPVMILREYCLDCLTQLSNAGVVTNMKMVDETIVRDDTNDE